MAYAIYSIFPIIICFETIQIITALFINEALKCCNGKLMFAVDGALWLPEALKELG
jgi:hypothetical protein